MASDTADDIRRLLDELEAAEGDAKAVAGGLTEEQGTWRAEPGSWSVAECLDHLATANRVYLQAMREPAERARQRGSRRRRPVRPGWAGRLFVSSLEPPPKRLSRLKAPRKIRPRAGPPLSDAFAAFLASQAEVREFVSTYADVELAGVRFPNPFVRGIRFSLATGLHVITAHERRHLWQAWRVRRAMPPRGAASQNCCRILGAAVDVNVRN
jgi:DinB family protein